MPSPIRILTAVPICDGHDSAINTINLELVQRGVEVIYLGFHRSAKDIARAAVQEDVRAIGISSYNGGHVAFFAEVIDRLRGLGAQDIGVFGGGGGTISEADAAKMRRKGVDHIFFAGTPLASIVDTILKTYGGLRALKRRRDATGDGRLAQQLTEVETHRDAAPKKTMNGTAKIIGITGPGGAGKTTLIDELVLRLLNADPALRIAILSHDPSVRGRGALLGDRAAMIYSQDDRVFMRSLATRGRAGGLAPSSERSLDLLAGGGFGMIFVETVGTGQEATPFAKAHVDQTLLVMNPDYGSRLQLHKIAMLEEAGSIVVNKSDLARAKAAMLEIDRRIERNGRGQTLIATVAKHHRDPGVDELFRRITA
ncbi:MAG TPA: cobalamin-dependent protein [Bryobacteraceae bacterium]|nr:cobalamin-dependent protein [Bryobacteraceae bacterium]